ERGVEDVGAVRRGNDNDVGPGVETVHFHEDLVQRLLAFVMATTETSAALASHRVNFVDEHDAGGVLLGLVEQVADAARANTHEHFNELRTGDAEERHTCFTRNSA